MTKRASTPTSSGSQTAVVVVGMHRSGTSAMARVLGLAGADMPEHVIKAASDNPLGFWEPRDVVALNDEILRTVGSDWDDIFGARVDGLTRPLWADFLPRARSVLALNYAGKALAVMKDPRVSLLTPLWRQALAEEGFESVFVIMVRDPIEVAQSIAARDEATVQASVLAWLSHMIAVERDTRDAKRVFVRYSDLVDNWRPVLDRVGSALSVALPVTPKVADEISRFLSRSARHHTSDPSTWIERSDLWPGVAEAWRWLIEAAEHGGPSRPFPSTIAENLDHLEAQLGPIFASKDQAVLSQAREFQSILSDRERSLLRLKAQAVERQTADAERLEALAQMGTDLGRSIEALTELSTTQAIAEQALERQAAEIISLEEQRKADAAALAAAEQALERQAAEIISLEEQRKADAAALAATLDELSEALERIAALEQMASAETRKSQGRIEALRLDVDQAILESTKLRTERDGLVSEMVTVRTERDGLVSEMVTVRTERDELASRIRRITSSSSWKIARPVRVIQKRLRKPNAGS